MGRVGMSRKDFEQCTPSEFFRIVEQHSEEEGNHLRQGWERTRVQVISVMQLFSKKKLDPKDVFPLPWDNTGRANEKSPRKGTSSFERMKEMAIRSGLDP